MGSRKHFLKNTIYNKVYKYMTDRIFYREGNKHKFRKDRCWKLYRKTKYKFN